MSLFLPKLTCKKDIDEVIKGVAEKVVVLRFGRDEDSVCLQLDEIKNWCFMRKETRQTYNKCTHNVMGFAKLP
uniref:Thioredoxin-like 4A n=1 Tax=Seriola dumerili TaxID=41447 RepID=A0A3B4TR87_SERDU